MAPEQTEEKEVWMPPRFVILDSQETENGTNELLEDGEGGYFDS